jgi:hypothetical protein
MNKSNDIVNLILQERDKTVNKVSDITSRYTESAGSAGGYFTTIIWVLFIALIVLVLSVYFSTNCNKETSWLDYTLCLYRNFTTKLFDVTSGVLAKKETANTINDKDTQKPKTETTTTSVKEDSSSSEIQKGSGKRGWCFIGEDRGIRSCAKVGLNDKCMSGDIFPTSEICVNPKLRA